MNLHRIVEGKSGVLLDSNCIEGISCAKSDVGGFGFMIYMQSGHHHYFCGGNELEINKLYEEVVSKWLKIKGMA